MNTYDSSMAEGDFGRARAKEFFSRIQHFLSPEREKLLSLTQVKSILKPTNETYRGMQVVPVRLIVGSEGRYRDFNKAFLPRHDYLRQRWIRVDLAHYQELNLPPIQLYELGGVYFVRDGNHRVSVAKLQGVEAIDAEVVSLDSQTSITPDMTREELAKKVIDYEKKLFMERTNFEGIVGYSELDFSSPGQYDTILNHILVHKYYINQECQGEIPFEEAVRSWFSKVYSPIVEIIKENRITGRFPGRTEADLYVWIVKHWDQLKQKFGLEYPLEDAALDFAHKYGKEGRKGFFKFLRWLFSRKT